MKRSTLLLPFTPSLLLLGLGAGQAHAVSPKIVGAAKTGGVKQIANLNVGNAGQRSLGYRAVTRRIGKPSRRKGGGSTCYSVYGGAGLTLLFTSFGGARTCAQTYLQTAKRVPGFGYQVATKRSFGRRIGTVFLRFKAARVSSIYLWVGGAGDWRPGRFPHGLDSDKIVSNRIRVFFG